MGGHGRRRRRILLAALGLVALLAAGGCGASGGSESSTGTAAEAPAGGAPAGKDQAGAGAPDLRVEQRAIIYTGSVRIQVQDVDRAARDAIAVVTAAGGFIGGDQRRSSSSDAAAELELRIPATQFTTVIDEIAKLGRQQRREIRTEDVTEETIDLDARISSQRARVESARRLLARADTIGDLVTLEGELARREADLASLEAKKRRLADLTALSTLTVSFVGRDATTADEKTETGFLVGLRGGWKVFLISMSVMLTVLGAVLPWLIAFGVPLLTVLWVLRRRRRRSAPAAATAAPVPAARSAP